MTVTVELWYFDAAASGFPMPFASRAELLALPRTLVHSYESEAENVFDEAFARFNRGSGREDPALDAKELRSLSVGDVVIIRERGVGAICASLGWELIDANEITKAGETQ